jgi:hypothetical protein
MKISCLMPTYGRPTLVQNAIACFEAQDYPADRRRLLILDDAGQIAPHHSEGWSVWSMPLRMETLTAKYAKLGELDEGWAYVYVIWDDDDIYLPWHLSAHAIALRDSRGRIQRKSGVCMPDNPRWSRRREDFGLPSQSESNFSEALVDLFRAPALTSIK